MISSTAISKINIYITTYKRVPKEKPKMDDKGNDRKGKSNKFVCAICLNARVDGKNNESNKKITKSCPICQKFCDHCHNSGKRDKERIKSEPKIDANVKNVQTSDTEVNQGYNLLNEVLTVFKNKRVDVAKEKAGLFKDVGVSTEDRSRKDRSKLAVSNFQYSIDGSKTYEGGKFIIVCSCQPDYIRKSQYAIDLIKHKSSSIPQMKLEELKHSLKEKSRSKDAIEEVNRLFATVRNSRKSVENSNRPMVRSGPRVLPVVQNLRQETKRINLDSAPKVSCRCCHTCMSSGDSCIKPVCQEEYERCDNKCVYMTCCHYQNKQQIQAEEVACDHCTNLKHDYYCDQGCLNDD